MRQTSLSCLVALASLFGSYAFAPLAGCGHAPLPARAMSTAEAEVTVDINMDLERAKIYGRLADKLLVMGDGEDVGDCCHSGCDGCPFRYSFSIMQSGRPKWLPIYDHRLYDDGKEHAPRWTELFQEAGKEGVSKKEFTARLLDAPFAMPLGPSGFISPSESEPCQQALDEMWSRLVGEEEEGRLTHRAMLKRLQQWGDSGADALLWTQYQKAMTG